MDKEVVSLSIVGFLAILITVGIAIASKVKSKKEEFDDTKDIPVYIDELGV